MDDGTFPRDADIEQPDPTFESALVRNRGKPVRREPVERPLPVIDFAALTAARMAGKPRVEDLPF